RLRESPLAPSHPDRAPQSVLQSPPRASPPKKHQPLFAELKLPCREPCPLLAPFAGPGSPVALLRPPNAPQSQQSRQPPRQTCHAAQTPVVRLAPTYPAPPAAPIQPTRPGSLPARDHCPHFPARRSSGLYSSRPAPPFPLRDSAPPWPSATAAYPGTPAPLPWSTIPQSSARCSYPTGSAAAMPLAPRRRPRLANQACGKRPPSSGSGSPQTVPRSFRCRSSLKSLCAACHILSIPFVKMMTKGTQSL